MKSFLPQTTSDSLRQPQERQKYHLCLHFEYGPLDDGSIWIRTPKKGLFHVDGLTLRLLQELNTGLGVETLANKYKLEAKEIFGLLANLEKEGGLVSPRQGKITQGRQPDDIHLVPYALLMFFLAVIQVEYFQSLARTLYLRYWYEGVFIGICSIAPIILHELGHYLAAKPYFPPRLGFTFLWFFPAVYLDTQGAWCLPRNIRLLINSAGLMSDLVFNSLLVGLVLWKPAFEYFVTPFLVLQYTRWMIILNPLMNGDGYWLLADFTKTVNLRQRGRESLVKRKFHWLSIYGFLSLLLSLISCLGFFWFIINLLGRGIPIFLK